MVNRLTFSIEIKAEKQNIWQALWEAHFYQDWAGTFSEGAHVVTDHWKVDSTVLFLDPDKSGVYSIIEAHIPNEVMSFKHIGLVKDGQPQPLDEATKQWSGTTETYTLTQAKDGHTLLVEIDILDEHLDFMKQRFPKALETIKNNACAI